METFNGKIPSMPELFRLVQELTVKIDKQEKEISRLKNYVQVKQKKVIVDILNSPAHTPLQTFEQWWRSFKIDDEHLDRVFKYDLNEGIKMVIEQNVNENKKNILPIRCFTQKPNIYYIYSLDDKTNHYMWKNMGQSELEMMLMYLSQEFLRVFLKWKKVHMAKEQDESEEYNDQDEDKNAKELMYMMKINGMGTSPEKRQSEIKKWLFTFLEENAQNIEYEYE
jgi:hypothetical protein